MAFIVHLFIIILLYTTYSHAFNATCTFYMTGETSNNSVTACSLEHPCTNLEELLQEYEDKCATIIVNFVGTKPINATSLMAVIKHTTVVLNSNYYATVNCDLSFRSIFYVENATLQIHGIQLCEGTSVTYIATLRTSGKLEIANTTIANGIINYRDNNSAIAMDSVKIIKPLTIKYFNDLDLANLIPITVKLNRINATQGELYITMLGDINITNSILFGNSSNMQPTIHLQQTQRVSTPSHLFIDNVTVYDNSRLLLANNTICTIRNSQLVNSNNVMNHIFMELESSKLHISNTAFNFSFAEQRSAIIITTTIVELVNITLAMNHYTFLATTANGPYRASTISLVDSTITTAMYQLFNVNVDSLVVSNTIIDGCAFVTDSILIDLARSVELTDLTIRNSVLVSLLTYGATSHSIIVFAKVSNITIVNSRYAPGGPSIQHSLLSFSASIDVQISDLNIHGSKFGVILIAGGVDTLRLTGITLSNCIFTKSFLKDILGVISIDSCNHLSIHNATIKDSSFFAIPTIIDIVSSFASTISNLHFSNGTATVLSIKSTTTSVITNSSITNTNSIQLTGNEALPPAIVHVSALHTLITGLTMSTCYGTAVELMSSTATISNATFNDNISDLNAGSSILYAQNSKLKMSNCQFINNQARAGTLVLLYSSCSLDNSLFHNNVGAQGSAIALYKANILVNSSSFVNNSAEHKGGAMQAIQSNVTISSSSFEKNSAASGFGGALHLEQCTSTISATSFTNNYSEFAAGVLYCAGSNITVTSSNFTLNKARTSNGGVLLAHGHSCVEITNSQFYHNSALTTGGALDILHSTSLSLYNCTFSSDYLLGAAATKLHLSDEATAIIHSVHFNNLLVYEPLIAIQGIANVTISSCTFLAVSASLLSEVAVIDIQDSAFGLISSCNFKQCSGVLILQRSKTKTTIGNCCFRSNEGICVRSSGIATIQSSTFTYHSGTVLSISQAGSIALQNSILTNITNEDNSVCVVQGSLTSMNATFANNVARGVLVNREGKWSSSNDVFRNNHAPSLQAAAAFLASNNLRIINGTFENNLAAEGGALYIETESSGQTTIAGCTFSYYTLTTTTANSNNNNTNTTPKQLLFVAFIYNITTSSNNEAASGGAILVSKVADNMQVNSCSFVNNSADIGGAITYLAKDEAILQISNSTFSFNKAAALGGAIYIGSQIAAFARWLDATNFTDNNAGWGGPNVGYAASLSVENSTNLCTGCSFQYAAKDGYGNQFGFASEPTHTSVKCPGSVYLDDANVTLQFLLQDNFDDVASGGKVSQLKGTLTIATPEVCYSDLLPLTANFSSAGAITFPTLQLKGVDGKQCKLQFIVAQHIAFSSSCEFVFSGCLEGNPETFGKFDSCVASSGPLQTIALTSIFTAIVLLIFATLLVVLAVFIYKKRKQQFEMQNIPNFEETPLPTLAELLSDPDITQIRWSSIEVVAPIGTGASGVVSKGWWHYNNDQISIAIKQLHVGNMNYLDAVSIQEFLTEIKLLSTMRNKYITAFHGISLPSCSEICFITELMDRGNLRTVIDSKKCNLPWKLRCKLLQDAARGLAYLHKCNIIHRDIKPENLLVSNDWQCKVADFGVSTVSKATKTMTLIGTPIYIAPEVLTKDKASFSADVYSYGIMLCEVYTSENPFKEELQACINSAHIMYKIINEKLKPDTSTFPPELAALVSDCINSNPKKRPAFPEIVLRLARLDHLQLPTNNTYLYSDEVITSPVHVDVSLSLNSTDTQRLLDP